MSDAMTVIKQSPKPPLGQRLRSWKWWVYGDMSSQPLEKAPKGYRLNICLGIAIWLSLGVYPWIDSWINRHPPEFSSLQSVRGVITNTSRKSPQFILQLTTGERVRLEYQGFLGIYGRETGLMRRLGDENQNVLGCSATVWFDVPRFTLWKRNRVWQIACDNSPHGASYENFREYFKKWNRLIYWGVIIFFLIPLGMAIISIRFRRGFYD